MARPLKEGLDYFPFDVDFFSDIKVRRLIKGSGPTSSSILICLLCNIYQDKGYYIEWNKDLPFLIADTIGVSEGAVEEVIKKAIQVELFDESIYEKYNVLTSVGIQSRYILVTERRKKIDLISEYVLIDVGKKRVNDNKNKVNVDNNSINDNRSTQSKVKESKEKEILSKESTKKEDKSSSCSQSDYEKFNEWIKRKAPYCANPKNFTSQISESEFDKLKQKYTGQQVAETILQIENRKDLRKRYTNLYRTVLNWLKKEYPDNNQKNKNGHQLATKPNELDESTRRKAEIAERFARAAAKCDS